MTLPETYSVADVAQAIGRSTYWLAKEARHKRITHLRIGREIRFTEAHVSELLRKAEVRPAVTGGAIPGLTPRSAARARRAAQPAAPA